MRVSDAFVSLYGKMIARGFTRLGKAAASFHTLPAELRSTEPLFAGSRKPRLAAQPCAAGRPACSWHFVNGRDPLSPVQEVALTARCCSDSWTPDTNMTERFDCHYCKESLFGKKYILKEDSPYCVKCYENLYSNTCEECKKPIGADCKDLSYKDRHWHETCFHCFQCKNSLVDKPFAAKEEHLLCTDCYSNEYSSKCNECKKTIMPGTRKMEYKGNSWHETCFICYRCQQPIGTKSFIPKDNQNFCVPCYEKQFAMQCVQCKKAITTGGVTYREQPWHKECFVCTACKKQLSGQRFTSRDEFAYCLSCFCNLYAKKCAGCTNPISGLGGTKYISFEERQWHNDCFNCKKCSLSLVGRGFLTERDDILCPECGKDI